jgi:predicted  nucleic acid-binding Zn-ribbon protein
MHDSIDELILVSKLDKMMATQKARIKLTPNEIVATIREEQWISKAEFQDLGDEDLQDIIEEKSATIANLYVQLRTAQTNLGNERVSHRTVEDGLKSQLDNAQKALVTERGAHATTRSTVSSLTTQTVEERAASDRLRNELVVNNRMMNDLTKQMKRATDNLNDSTRVIKDLRAQITVLETPPKEGKGKMKTWIKKVWNR